MKTVRGLSERNLFFFALLAAVVSILAVYSFVRGLPALLSFLPPPALHEKALLDIAAQGAEETADTRLVQRMRNTQHDPSLMEQTLYEAKKVYNHRFYFSLNTQEAEGFYHTGTVLEHTLSLGTPGLMGDVAKGIAGAYYLACYGDVLMLVLSNEALEEPHDGPIQGTFIPMDESALAKTNAAHFAREGSYILLPYMLDTTHRFFAESVWQSLVALGLVGLAVYMVFKTVAMAADEQKRPIYRALQRLGVTEADMDALLPTAHKEHHRTHVGPWVLTAGLFTTKIR